MMYSTDVPILKLDAKKSPTTLATQAADWTYMEFLDKEIIYLNICLNDDQVLKMLGASNNRNNSNAYAGSRIPQKDTHQIDQQTSGDKRKLFKKDGKIYDTTGQKICPAGCNQQHFDGSLKFCKAFKDKDMNGRWEPSRNIKSVRCVRKTLGIENIAI